MTPKPHYETLIEAWEKVRRTVGDDIAQQAFLQTLARKRTDINEVAYFMTEVRWLRVERYDDTLEMKKDEGQRYRMSTALDWQEVVDDLTPEDLAISREQLKTVDQDLIKSEVDGKYVPRARLKQLRAGVEPPTREEMDRKHRDAARESWRRCAGKRREHATQAGGV